MPLDERSVISEHALEIRHRAFGALLDMRGRIADAVAAAGQMTSWSITDNRIEFKPSEDDEREIGFVSHRNFGYLVRSPDTRNYMHRAMRFVRDLLQVQGYELRDAIRFGFRSLFLIPSRDSFGALLNRVNQKMPLPTKLIEVFDAQIEDYGPVVILKRGDTHIKVRCGPMKKEQAKTETPLGSQKDRLPEVGFFVDIDHHQTTPGRMDDRRISGLLQQMIDSAWKAAAAYHDLIL